MEKGRGGQARPAASGSASDGPDGGSVDLLSEFAAADRAAGVGPREMDGCPKCGSPVMPGQVLCVQCGTDLRSGKKLKTDVRDRDPGEAPPPPSPVRLALAALGAAVGAGAGLGAWMAASSASGMSMHAMALLVGAAAAALPLLCLRGAGSAVSGVLAATMAFFAVSVGIRLSPPDRVEGFDWTRPRIEIPGGVVEKVEHVAGLDESERLRFDGAWVALGVLTALGLGSTNPYDDEDDGDGDGA